MNTRIDIGKLLKTTHTPYTHLAQVLGQISRGVDHRHSSAREHIRGAHQHGETNVVSEGIGLFERGQLPPARLVYANGVQETRELVAVTKNGIYRRDWIILINRIYSIGY